MELRRERDSPEEEEYTLSLSLLLSLSLFLVLLLWVGVWDCTLVCEFRRDCAREVGREEEGVCRCSCRSAREPLRDLLSGACSVRREPGLEAEAEAEAEVDLGWDRELELECERLCL